MTGAAGRIGTLLRPRLASMADTLRLADIAVLGKAAPNEELVTCDLGDREAVDAMVAGCDGIVHLGGIPTEANWTTIRHANFDGVLNLYDAARRHGFPRIVFASSNHAVGFHRQADVIDSGAALRPDSLYGVSKVFGEGVASMYHDKFGQESALVRIGTCFETPTNRRMLKTWLSPDDFVRLIDRCFKVEKLGCPVVYGVSANEGVWWDNAGAAHLGWEPQDSAEPYRAQVEASTPALDPAAPENVFQGGSMTALDIDLD